MTYTKFCQIMIYRKYLNIINISCCPKKYKKTFYAYNDITLSDKIKHELPQNDM